MKIWKQKAVIGIVAVIAFAFVACGGDDNITEIQRDFTIKMWDKDITVTDTRTGKNDKDLQELGIIKQLEDVIVLFGNFNDDAISVAAFNTILPNFKIIVEKPANPYSAARAKAADNTMSFDIDYLTNPTTQTTDIASAFYDAVRNYLFNGLDKTE